jgi:decaprenyl-phosphate phosphoribosyltransferase
MMARADHWVKNGFMLLGALLAVFYRRDIVTWDAGGRLALAFTATCLLASANYVLNELLDAATDRSHPVKRHRPVPSGQVRPVLGYLEWIALAAVGLWLSASLGTWFVASAAALLAMGLLYNVPPVRLKDWPYLDVLSESVNNPLRLLLGWFALLDDRFPPVSLILAYWAAGAFFMATKRLAEYRELDDATVAAAYRRSFAYYTQDRLLVSLLFYATISALFAGIFIVRYRLELILFAPLGSGVLAGFLRLGLRTNSGAQHPERLYRETPYVAYLVLCLVVFVVLMFTEIPVLYRWFNVEPSNIQPLWRLGTARPASP